MKKFAYVIAALGALAIVAPSIASAEDVVVRRDRDHIGARADFREDRGEFRRHRAEFREHRGWRRHHDKVVIVKRSHREY